MSLGAPAPLDDGAGAGTIPGTLWRRWRLGMALGLVAALGAMAPLARAWIAGLTLLHRDQTGQYAPLRSLIGTALRHGRLPLWNPYCATGMPLLAETTHGALHPLSVAVAFLFTADGLDPLVGAWIAAAALGAAVFARSLGASWAASLVAAFGYALSGWTLSMTSNLVGLAGAGSAPWVVAGLRVAGRDRSVLAFAGAAGAVAAGALAGDVQALAVATALGLALALEAGGLRGAALALGAAANGALLAAVQLAPSWSFLQHTDRVLPLPQYEKGQWNLAPWRLVELLVPGFFTVPPDGMGPAPVYLALGHPTLYTLPLAESISLGAAVLLAAVAGARASRTGRTLLGAAAIIGWFAMGRHMGARAIQDLLPIAAGWRYGEKYLTCFTLCVAALAALGADRLVADPARARRWAHGAAGAAATLLVAWAAVALGRDGGILAALGVPEASQVRDHVIAGLPHAILGAAAASGSLWLASRGRATLAAAGLAAVTWASGAASSWYALRPGLPEARVAAPPKLQAPPPGPRVHALGSAPPGAPRAGWDAIDERNFEVAATYTPNTNVSRRVDAFAADTGLTPIRWRVLVEALGADVGRAVRRYAVTHLVLPAEYAADPRLASALENARPEVNDPRTGRVFWAIPHRDWAVFPAEAVAVPDMNAGLDELVRAQREGRRTAFIEADVGVPTAPGRVLEISRGLEDLRIVADAADEATLVVNDAFWPGWRAFIDGAEVPIVPADVLVRSVRFPRGRHTLVMRYDPPELRTGLVLSAVGVASLVAAVWALRAARKRRRRGDEAA